MRWLVTAGLILTATICSADEIAVPRYLDLASYDWLFAKGEKYPEIVSLKMRLISLAEAKGAKAKSRSRLSVQAKKIGLSEMMVWLDAREMREEHRKIIGQLRKLEHALDDLWHAWTVEADQLPFWLEDLFDTRHLADTHKLGFAQLVHHYLGLVLDVEGLVFRDEAESFFVSELAPPGTSSLLWHFELGEWLAGGPDEQSMVEFSSTLETQDVPMPLRLQFFDLVRTLAQNPFLLQDEAFTAMTVDRLGVVGFVAFNEHFAGFRDEQRRRSKRCLSHLKP